MKYLWYSVNKNYKVISVVTINGGSRDKTFVTVDSQKFGDCSGTLPEGSESWLSRDWVSDRIWWSHSDIIMENKAADIDRALEDDELCTMETTRMRPYLDIWDVSSYFQTKPDPLVKHIWTRFL
jgi:hypothetical protein